MTLWLILAAMTALALVFVLPPLVRRNLDEARRLDHEVEIYRDQLREVERDHGLGVISKAEADAARTEIGRRLLAAADASGGPVNGGRSSVRTIALIVAVVVPVGALVTYFTLGMPDAPRQLAALETKLATRGNDDLQARIDTLLRRVEAAPDDGAVWAQLGDAFVAAGRAPDAVQAFESALARGEEDAALLSAYGEALTLAADGIVTPAARRAIERALESEPADFRARYYAGLAQYQEGDARRAVSTWVALERDSPPGAPWLPMLAERITALADQFGIDTADRDRTPAAGPSASDLDAAAEMSEDDRQAMIESMVAQLAARLESDPDDREGWLRLARSYEVLNRPAAARDAMARVAALSPNDAAVMAQLGRLTYEAEGAPEMVSPAVAELMERALTLDEGNPLALWFVGVVAEQSGDVARARTLWQRLLAMLDPATPQYRALEARLQALPDTP